MDIPEMESRMPDFIQIAEGHVIGTRGIMSIRTGFAGEITVRYIGGHCETITEISMPELLSKLGRDPLHRGSADSA